MGWLRNERFIAGGITLIVLGIIIFGISSWIQNVQSNNIQRCNQLTGQLAQSLDSNTATTCSNSTFYLAAANTGIVVAIIMIVVGIALTISGALLRKTETSKTETAKIEQYDIPPTQPCKACGKSINWIQDSIVEGPDIWHVGCYEKKVSHDGVAGN
jgi:uncharacterized membrane protein